MNNSFCRWWRSNRAVCTVLVAALVAPPAMPGSSAGASAQVTLLAADANGVLLELSAPAPQRRTVTVDGQRFTALDMAGTLPDARPGAPQTPVVGALLAVPPEATVTVEIVSLQTHRLAVDAPLLSAPAPAPPDDAMPDQPLALAPATYPAAELVDLSWWRSQRVARVRLRPVRVADGTVLFHPRLVVRVRFVQDRAATLLPAGNDRADEGAFEPILRTTLLNYAQGLGWRAARAATGSSSAIGAASDAWWRVTLATAGLVFLDCATLAAAGVPVSPATLPAIQLYDQGRLGRALPTRIVDPGAGSACDAQSGIVFYAPPAPSTYAAHQVVWLTVNTAVLPAMVQPPLPADTPFVPVTTTMTSRRYEVNRLYYSYVPLVEGATHWYWDLLAPLTGAARTYPFTLAAGSELGTPVTVALEVAGYDGAHVTQLFVNDSLATAQAWTGRTHQVITATVQPATLRPGANELRVVAAGTGDLQYVDAFTVTAAQLLGAAQDQAEIVQPAGGQWRYTVDGFTTPDVAVYDISTPPALRVMAATVQQPCPCTVTFADDATGARRYLAVARTALGRPLAVEAVAATNLRAGATQADYVMLAPAALLAATAPLAAHRAAQGLTVRRIDLQAVYDEFGDGRPHPEAVRALIAHALAAWPRPAPAYVLLVGDGTYDPLGYLGAPPAAPAPAYLRLVDARLGETASDNRLASTWDSPLPQLLIGRLPATTEAEVTAMTDKIVAFEHAPAGAAWRGQAVLVADNAFAADGAADPGGNFWQKTDAAAALLAAHGVSTDRLYYNPCDAGAIPTCAPAAPEIRTFATAASLTAALTAAWQASRRFVIYTGHGSLSAWAGAPTLLTAADIPALESVPAPVVLEMSCYTGFFHAPQRPSLAESLLRRAGGGAVATWSSSGQSVARGHDLLLARFLAAALVEPAPTLGEAILAAKSSLFADGGGVYDDLLDTFHLFGDPALQLAPRPAPPPPTVPPIATPGATPTALPGVTPGPTPGTGNDTPPAITPVPPHGTTTPPATAELFLPLVRQATTEP